MLSEPFVKAGDALTIVSFELRAHDASREAAEDRSLNLALRRRRVRSEVLRIALDADAATKAFLTDVIAALSGRRLVILARELRIFPEAVALAERLCNFASAAYVVIFGSADVAFAHSSASVIHLEYDGRAEIEMLADALIIA